MVQLPSRRKLQGILETLRGLVRVGVYRNVRPRGLVDAALRIARGEFDVQAASFRLHRLNIGDRLAVIGTDRSLTWRQLDLRSNRLANAVRGLGVGPGDQLGVMLPNSAAWIECASAALKIRAKAVAVGYRLSAREVAHVLTDGDCRVLVFASQYADCVLEAAKLAGTSLGQLIAVGDSVAGVVSFEDALAQAADTDPPKDPRRGSGGIIVYTSGTTGRPKGAVRAVDKGVVPFFLALIRVLPLKAGDVHLTPSPLYHSLALLFLTVGFALGSTNVVMEHWDPEEALDLMRRHRVGTVSIVPTMLKDLTDLPQEVYERYGGVRPNGFLASGARLGPDLRAAVMDRFGPCLYDLYGATEYGFVVYAGPEQMRRNIDALGVVFPGCEIRLLDVQDREVPVGEIGELYARTSMLFQGYYKRPEATAEGTRGGFFSVGDMARRDSDGFYYIADRKADMIVSGGANIYSAEIEIVLHEHPAIDEAAVIGVPDERFGEAVKAYVVFEPGQSLTAEEVQEFCAERIASFKKPRHVAFVTRLPKNPTGKILKRTLREWHADGVPEDTADAGSPAV